MRQKANRRQQASIQASHIPVDDLSIFISKRPPKQCFKSQFYIFNTIIVPPFPSIAFGYFGTESHPYFVTAGNLDDLVTNFMYKFRIIPANRFFCYLVLVPVPVPVPGQLESNTLCKKIPVVL